ncbi:MAG: trypsin-like peptidase domain-containing protein [Legionellales bacterium]|nr:trypsin-like peptidase domain-containing protein [Legionellales bacterium]
MMSETIKNNQFPISTQWTIDAAGNVGREVIPNVLMIYDNAFSSKGSGFLIDNGFVVTNLHVISGAGDVKNIIGQFSDGRKITFSKCHYNKNLDLVLLEPTDKLSGGLKLDLGSNILIGESVYTWGFPLGYNGPSPLFSTGFLSGFVDRPSINSGMAAKHLIINGAFNNGNSGGALFKSDSDRVIGVVVSKHMPLAPFHQSAIRALAHNKSGVTFEAKDDNGRSQQFVESQIVADILMAYQPLVQVMIGEAICSSELNSLILSVKR